MGKARPTSRQRRQNRPPQSGQSGLQTARGQERERRQSRPAAERMRRREVPPVRRRRGPMPLRPEAVRLVRRTGRRRGDSPPDAVGLPLTRRPGENGDAALWRCFICSFFWW